MMPMPPNKEHVERIREVAETLRHAHPERYVDLADRVENDLGLNDAKVDAAHLGEIETFRFEEGRLLTYAGELIAAKKYEEALTVITERGRSFWIDRNVSRQAQWESCRLMVELGCEFHRIRPALSKMGSDPAEWLAAYKAIDGWYQVDSLHRRLETWVARMDEEPEAEKALAVVRREHEELLKRVADCFAIALREAEWTAPGVLH